MKISVRKVTLIAMFAVITFSIEAQTSAIYPMDFVPHEETTTEIRARETRLATHETNFFNGLNSAIANGTLISWVNSYLPALDISPSQVVYSNYYYVNALYELTKLSTGYNYPELNTILIDKLNYTALLAFQTFKNESQNDKTAGFSGFPNDLNTVHAANSMLCSSVCLKLLGAYSGIVKDSTEAFITRYVENKGEFDGFYQSTGYNKEIYKMDIGCNVLFLYFNDPTKFPITKKTFETFWTGLTKCSYDGDNSPHYDGQTGIWVALRMALTLDHLDDLKIRDDFHRILTRMAHTVMNSGETAKWGKSMGGTLNNNSELTNDGSTELSWTLKMGYKLFNDSFLLYVARKYEDLRLNGPVTSWHTNISKTYPKDINFSSVKNAMPLAGTHTSFTTKRLTSKTAYSGLLLGRGDTNTELVQDKLILSTGHHPRAPYFLMDLSYTQSKASVDHRIGADNLMFDGTHLCTYLDRPGNGNQISRPFLCPQSYSFPIVGAVAGEVSPSADYTSMMSFNPSFDYILKTDSTKDLDKNSAYGVVEYSKFQYSGVSAKREILLLHNGIMFVLDRIKAGANYSGGHNAGVIYQVWPSIQSKDIDNRWVLQGNHIPTLVDKSANPNGFGTLYYFPSVGTQTQTRIATDPNRPSSAVCQTFSASKTLNPNDSVVILSMIIPIRNTRFVQSLINSIQTSENNGTFKIIIPNDSTSAISVKFEPNRLPVVNVDLPTTGIDEPMGNMDFELKQNFPNPFHHSTTINYQLTQTAKIHLSVYNVLGSEVASLVNETQSPNKYQINFNASALSKGIYYLSLLSGKFVSTRKIIID